MDQKYKKPTSIFNLKKRKGERRKKAVEQHFEHKMSAMEDAAFTDDVNTNVGLIRESLGNSDDMVIRHFYIAGDSEKKAAFVYLDGLANATTANQFIIRAAMFDVRKSEMVDVVRTELGETLKMSGLPISEVAETDKLKKAIRSILSGDSVLLIDKTNKAILSNTKGWDKRGIQEPSTESVVRGPRDGFTETLRSNTAQIRRRVKDPNLRVKNMIVGQRSNTDVAIMYLEDVANKKVVDEIMARIHSIDIDAAMDSGYIEQFIEDTHWTPFPLIQNTERPDKAAANIFEGKVAIVCDGSPFVLIAPSVFSQFYHSPEDYYERFLIGTLIRFIRILSMGIAVLLPSLYIAFSSFHPEMIPSRLVIAMAAGRSTVPFPSIVEAFLMEVTMEILREASVRLPGPIGPTIGIVGALVVGQAAVQAGIVSPIMVIIVALTTIGSFASPSYSAAIALRMLRFPMMASAAMFGLYGIMLFLILILVHLCSLKSFGVPYLAPITPLRLRDLKDVFIRVPLNWMKRRPGIYKPQDPVRMKTQQKGDADGSEQSTANPKSES